MAAVSHLVPHCVHFLRRGVINLVAIIGAVLMLLSQRAVSFETIIAGRFLYGFSRGISFAAHTMYLIECSPECLRGKEAGRDTDGFLSFGKFVGQLLGISKLLGTRENWPWLLAFNGFMAFLQLCTAGSSSPSSFRE
uniref:solute carrier family 2 member 11, like n=1 Tax=Gasterosteus aculeatus aculeatus TaxID=481459 RepID=UPI001A99811C|nr:solute carrier family 2 member 11, like [Gasterosteus aculeatus aculeatus]